MSLKKQAIEGVAWNSIGQIGNTILQFILSIILMRLLKPDDYGILAMAMVCIGFVGILNEFGVSTAIVQNRDIQQSELSSIFWFMILNGMFFTVLIYVGSSWIAHFFHTDQLKDVLRWLSLNFLIGSIGVVPAGLLQQQMKFKMINIINIISVILSGIAGIYLAYIGKGVMSLVAQALCALIITVLLRFIFCNWYPLAIFKFSHLKKVFSFSFFLTGYSVVDYWSRRADDLLVGKFLGSTALGIYSRGYYLMLRPIAQIYSIIGSVVTASFSAIQHDKKKIRESYVHILQITSLFIFPALIGLSAVSDNLVIAVFGDKWKEAIPIIRILSLSGIPVSLSVCTSWIYISQNKTGLMFYWGLFNSVMIILSVLIGLWYGSLIAIAIAYTIANVLLLYPAVLISGRLISLNFKDFILKITPELSISLFMGAMVYLIGKILPQGLTDLQKSVIQILSGIIIFSTCVYVFQLHAFKLIKSVLTDVGISKTISRLAGSRYFSFLYD